MSAHAAEPVLPYFATEAPRRIVVFRALVLGDMLCALPALRALRRAAPEAHIVLVGLASMRDLIGRFDDCIDLMIPFPGRPGFPEQPEQPERWPGFIASLRAMAFDLAIQMHGCGENANAIVRSFGARHDAGFRLATELGATHADRDRCFIAWREHESETLRCLSLIHALGVPADWSRDARIQFPVTRAERHGWYRLRDQHLPGRQPFVCVHAGARWPSRRWPVERFAEVATGLAERGLRVVLTGAADERPLVDTLSGLLQANGVAAVNLCGATGLGVLAAMLEEASLLVCNDTGISHVAATTGTPSVVIASGSDVPRWRPLDAYLHTVLWQDLPCRPCSFRDCPVGHVCARAVNVDDVLSAAFQKVTHDEPAC